MSCGNASCHETNSLHRIKKNNLSGGTYRYAAPGPASGVPEISTVDAVVGSKDLVVTFTEGVYTNTDPTPSGALVVSDFVYTDVGGGGKTITSVTHSAGSATAVITLSGPVSSADVGKDLLATRGMSIFNAASLKATPLPAGPWPVTLASCPPAPVLFALDEAGGSTTASDSSGFLWGPASAAAFIGGDGLFHGDPTQGTYASFTSNDRCLKEANRLTVEALFRAPAQIDGDYAKGMTPAACTSDFDCDAGGAKLCACGADTAWHDPSACAPACTSPNICNSRTGTCQPPATVRAGRCPGNTGGCDADSGSYNGCTDKSQCASGESCFYGFCSTKAQNGRWYRIFERRDTLLITLIRADYRGDNRPERANKASIEVKFRVDDAVRHLWPHPEHPLDTTSSGLSKAMHQVSTDIDFSTTPGQEKWPLISGHWYRLRVVFNSAKPYNPIDIYLDDRGTNTANAKDDDDTNDVGQIWTGFRNAAQNVQDSGGCMWGPVAGETIQRVDRSSYIGSAWTKTKQNFDGLIDWVSWNNKADYNKPSGYNGPMDPPACGGQSGGPCP